MRPSHQRREQQQRKDEEQKKGCCMSFCSCFSIRKKPTTAGERSPLVKKGGPLDGAHPSQDYEDIASLSTKQDLDDHGVEIVAPKAQHSSHHHQQQQREHYCEEDFELVRRLGKGGFGEVFLAKHKSTGQFFALKTMDKTLIESDRQMDAYIERDIMNKLHHPNVLCLHGTFQSPTHLFYLMDFCAGGDMVHFLDRVPESRVCLPTARNWAAQTWLAVTFMHANGIIYRDLKPENILLTREGSLIMADFGLSKQFGDQQELLSAGAASIVGSPYYIAPEILDAHNNGNYAQSVDWWSFGIFVYRLIYGRNPFNGKTKRQLFDAIRHDPVSFPQHPRIPGDRDVRDLISRLLVKDPAHRITSMEISSHPFFTDVNWGELADGRIPVPIEWKRPPSAEELARGAERERLEPKVSNHTAPGQYPRFSADKQGAALN